MNNSVGMFNSFVVCNWFSDKAKALWTNLNTLQGWIDIEVALANAQAELGLIPKEAADVIAQKADASLFDLEKMSQDIKHTMHPLVPFLHQYEDICGKEAGDYIHWGATTQNIIEAGAILQLKKAHDLMMADIATLINQLAELADESKNVPQAGRTHGQHALPITFGFKVAAWREEVRRHQERLTDASRQAFSINMGGAVGTFASMEGKGKEIQDKMAQALGLYSPNVPVRTSCDSLSTYLCLLGLMAATFEKIAQEVIFLQRTEISEVEEKFHYGKIGSSTMPQKRNPSRAMNIVGLTQILRSHMSAATMSMIRPNEGFSSQENILYALLPEISMLAISVVENMNTLIGGLKVNEDKMRENLDITGGLILSESVMLELGRYIGRLSAHHVIYDASIASVAKNMLFKDAIREELKNYNVTNELDLDTLLIPENYLGEAAACVTLELKS